MIFSYVKINFTVVLNAGHVIQPATLQRSKVYKYRLVLGRGANHSHIIH